MKAVTSTFTKREAQAYEVSELEIGKWYLASRRFNAKRIIDQPAMIVDADVFINSNGHQRLKVKWTDGTVGEVFITEVDGVLVCADNAGQPSIKPLTTKWLNRERAKLQKQVDEAQTTLDQLDQVTV